MFTASRRIRNERTSHNRKATALIIAVLVLANAAAIVGLGSTARAEGFPDAMQYAPMTWEKQAPALPEISGPRPKPAQTVTIAPVERRFLEPAASASANKSAHEFAQVRTTAVSAATGDSRFLLIALMTAALGTMAGVSVHMFRTLAREISEAEHKRTRL